MNRVNPLGPVSATIALVGEAPGQEEAMCGVPFVGKSGQLLTRMLNVAGITRSEVYITNVVKFRPPNNKLDRLHEIGIKLEDCYEELRKELATLPNVNVIVAVGGTALKALTGQGQITKLRGSIMSVYIDGRHIKVIPTIHPAYALQYDYSSAFFIAADLIKARKESESAELNLPRREFILDPDFSTVMQQLDRIEREATILSLDIETSKPFRFIKCLGLSHRTDWCLCIPFIHNKRVVWTEAEEIAIWTKVRSILTNPRIGKIIQNQNFELECLYEWIGEITPIRMDTMLAQGLCYPEIKKDLGTIVSLYTRQPYFKDDAKEGKYEGMELWRYNCLDVTTTLEVVEKLEAELSEFGMLDFFYGYTMPLAVLLWRASRRGISVDSAKCSEYIDYYRGEEEKDKASLEALIGKPLNVNSPKQVKEFLYNDLKCAKMKIGKKVGATDEETVFRLSRKYPKHKAMLDLILSARKNGKMASTFLEGITDADGKVHTTWKVQGAETGRLSSSKNATGTGMNMQNIPTYKVDAHGKVQQGIRDMFIASEGKVLVKADLSQVEARLVAYMSEDPAMMQIFEDGIDIHSQVSAWTYNIPIEQVDRKTQRAKVKHVVHGANYDIGARKFAYKVDIPEHEAKFLLNKYHGIFPGIRRWYKLLQHQLSTNRTITNPFGRRRMFYGWWGENMFREAYANLPQGTAVDIINMGATRVQYLLPDGAFILLQVHDELVIECYEYDVLQVASLLRQEIEKPVMINGHSVSIPLDIGWGPNWKEATKEVPE